MPAPLSSSPSRRALLAGALACSVLPAGGATAAPLRELRVADAQPDHYPTVLALRHMDGRLRDWSQGRLALSIYPDRQLGEERETVEQVRTGAIDLARVNVTALEELVPEVSVLALPFLFRSIDHLRAVVDGDVGRAVLDRFPASGIRGLTFYDGGARSFYTASRPIRTPADMAGMRIRIQQSGVMRAVLETLGAEPVPLAYGQVATALSANLVDGAENNWPSYFMSGHFRLARYYAPTEHLMAPEVLLVSGRAWAGLSPEDRAILVRAAAASRDFLRGHWREAEARARIECRAAGTEVSTVDKPAFAAATEPVRSAMLRDPVLRDLAGRIREAG